MMGVARVAVGWLLVLLVLVSIDPRRSAFVTAATADAEAQDDGYGPEEDYGQGELDALDGYEEPERSEEDRLVDTAWELRFQNRIEDALKVLDASREELRNGFEVQMTKGQLLCLLNRPDDAKAVFEVGLTLIEDDKEKHAEIRTHAYYDLAQASSRLAQQIDSDNSKRNEAVAHYNKSIEYYDVALKDLKNSGWAWRIRQVRLESMQQMVTISLGSWMRSPYVPHLTSEYSALLASEDFDRQDTEAQFHALTNGGKLAMMTHKQELAYERFLQAVKLAPKNTKAWSALCNALDLLNGTDAGMACGLVAVRKGVFERMEQRPEVFTPGVKNAGPWPDKTEYALAHNALLPLEESWQGIRKEALRLLDVEGPDGLNYGIQEGLEERENDDTPRGRWHARPLDCWTAPEESPVACAAVLRVNEHLRKAYGGITDVKKLVYEAQFLRLEPGGHIRPHCGTGNYRWVAHLGLVIPTNVTISVAEEARGWTEGKTILFDDSFVHEVVHNGSSDRLILGIQLPNPNYLQHMFDHPPEEEEEEGEGGLDAEEEKNPEYGQDDQLENDGECPAE